MDIEEVPVGADVQLVREDGALVEGKLADKGEMVVKVQTPRSTKIVARDEIAAVQVVQPDQPVEVPPAAKFREITVPAGTALKLALVTPLSSETSRTGDVVEATLENPLMLDGHEVLPAGSSLRGRVTSVESAGKVKGTSSLAFELDSLVAHDERYPIAAKLAYQSASTKKDDATKIGFGAAAGAIIGGMIGGGKGAATGAAVGAGAGTAVVLTTEGKPVTLAKGADLSIKIANDLDVKVPIK
jgi:hypothetical protein